MRIILALILMIGLLWALCRWSSGGPPERIGVPMAGKLQKTDEQWREVLTPEHQLRAREIATQMTKPEDSVTTAANLLEDAARRGV